MDFGVPRTPGTSAGPHDVGKQYLTFLKTVRDLLPDPKSLSVVLSPYYTYIHDFPVKEISKITDYIVFKGYDLHGQSDQGNVQANPGCLVGNCLRSHINKTEVEIGLNALVADGVSKKKIVMGMSSYGRSFVMNDTYCFAENCRFSGPPNVSFAKPGQ